MTSAAISLIDEKDPAKKTPEWFNLVLSSTRPYWRQLKNVGQERDNRAYMYSMQPMNKVMDSFDDEEFKKNTTFFQIPVLESILNAIVEETVKNPPRCELRAEDPTAINEKKEDIEKLKHRGIIERDRTELQQRVFGPDSQYKVPYDKFNGNVEEFDSLGLNERDPDDVNFYEKNYQRLWYEIGGQSLINNVLKTNQFDQTIIRKLVKDIFWSKTIAIKVYVDKVTGEIKTKYLDPITVWGIFGESNDGKDDTIRSFMDTVTVSEFIQMVGNDFDWERDWRYLLWGINWCNTQKFTGFIRGGINYDCWGNPEWMGRMGCEGVEQPNLIPFDQAYMFKIFLGYSEVRTWEATSTKMVNKNDPNYLDFVPYSFELKKKKIKEGYEKESKYQQQWYSGYFLATSGTSQYIFNFQKVYFQHIHGANDEYSNGTLCYYQEEGKSAVEIAKPYIQLVNFAYYRMLWIIYKSKPDADEFVFEELTQLAQTIKRDFPQAGTNFVAPKIEDVLMDLVKTMRKSHVRIRTYPRIDGKAAQQIPQIEKNGTGGLDPLAVAMQAITAWAENQIEVKIGFNPMRTGANPPSRESTATEERTLQNSYTSTGYFYRMIQYGKEHVAVATLNYATDILQYKDSLPYNWIMTLLGNESFEALKALDKFSAHRYGIWVEDYNYEFDRQKMLQAADIALSQKTLTMSQWAIITQTKNPKLGFKILAHLELKTKKKERAQAVQDKQIELNIAKQMHDMKMEEMEFDRGTKIGVAKTEGQALIESAKIQAGAKVEVKQLTNEAEPVKQQAKADADKQVVQEKANVEKQQPISV